MNRFIIDEFYRDPALRSRLFAEAHRESSRTIRAGLRQGLAALVGLGKRLIPRFEFGPRQWMQRLG